MWTKYNGTVTLFFLRQKILIAILPSQFWEIFLILTIVENISGLSLSLKYTFKKLGQSAETQRIF